MIKKGLNGYTDYTVKSVIPIKGGYGYRVVLKYIDGSEVVQQKSGFKSEKEANKARERTIAELYSATYVVYSNVSVGEYFQFWLEEDICKRITKYSTYSTFSGVVKNHIIPVLGKKRMSALTRADVQHLYLEKMKYSASVARLVKSVMNISMRYALNMKVIANNPASRVGLPKAAKKKYHIREIHEEKTLSLEQMQLFIEKSADTPIHMQVLLCILMGLRCSEMNGVKYGDINYFNRTLKIERQLGKEMNAEKEAYPPKMLTKQEIDLKTPSSHREIPIPDLVFEAILSERKKYEKNRSRRRKEFQDLDYICCSSYGRPRSRGYHWKHYKQLLKDCGLPDIRWHDLRSTFCTLLMKNEFSPKSIAKLLGHTKEIVTIAYYTDNKQLVMDGVPELQAYIDEVLPREADEENMKNELLEIVVDTTYFYTEE